MSVPHSSVGWWLAWMGLHAGFTDPKATKMTNTRTGASVRHTPSNCPAHLAITCGFTEEQAQRMIRVRRVLPFSDNRSTPYLDARKLWGRLGKPHGRFNDWADAYIKPLKNRPDLYTEISVKLTKGAKGRPRVDYDLSRNIAAHIAMMVSTPQAEDIRCYFLDMEELALKLAVRIPLRVSLIMENDKAATAYLRKHNGDKAKAVKLSRGEVIPKSLEQERHLKSMVCEVLTGYPTKVFRETHGKGVRDIFETDDLAIYSNAYSIAVCVMKAGKNRCDVRSILLPSFENRIDPHKYGIGLNGF